VFVYAFSHCELFFLLHLDFGNPFVGFIAAMNQFHLAMVWKTWKISRQILSLDPHWLCVVMLNGWNRPVGRMGGLDMPVDGGPNFCIVSIHTFWICKFLNRTLYIAPILADIHQNLPLFPSWSATKLSRCAYSRAHLFDKWVTSHQVFGIILISHPIFHSIPFKSGKQSNTPCNPVSPVFFRKKKKKNPKKRKKKKKSEPFQSSVGFTCIYAILSS